MGRSAISSICGLLLCLLVGCGTSGEVTCLNPSQSTSWLISEVNDDFESHPNGSFHFQFQNTFSHAVPLKVRSIGCSCYQVRQGETRLKVGDVVGIGPGKTETLVLLAPRPTTDRVSDYTFSLQYEPEAGQTPQVISCQGTLISVSDYRVNPSLVTAEFHKETPHQTVRFEVTHSTRHPEEAASEVRVTGWPAETEFQGARPVSEVTENPSTGLFQRLWLVEATIPRPDTRGTPQEHWPLKVCGTESESPRNTVQLMLRIRSGLSGPKLVHFGDVPLGQIVTRRIQVIARDQVAFRLIGPNDPQTGVSIQSDTPDAAPAHWGELKLHSLSPGDFHQVMEIQTDHPDAPTLSVDVHAHVVSTTADAK